MLRVTPIGSCRIAGPLQRGVDRYGYTLARSRTYGYCHSSGEAVQMARFIQGMFTPPAEIWPLMSRRSDIDVLEASDPFEPDLSVIELSSAKRLTVDGVFIQLNYFTNQFRDFLNDKPRADTFWDLATEGCQASIDQNLKSHGLDQSEADLLRRIRLKMTTPAQLVQDMETLQSILPRIVFVTHVNATKADGRKIETRAQFIDMVKEAGNACGASVYDPTEQMHAFGQTAAIADHSDSLAHFTDAFSDVVADDIAQIGVAPAIDAMVLKGSAADIRRTLMPHAVCMSEIGYQKTLHARVQAFKTKRPDLDGLNLIDADLCDLKVQATAIFDTLCENQEARSKNPNAFLLRAVELDRYTDISVKLDEQIDPWILLQTAKNAIFAHEFPVAIDLLCHALIQDPENKIAANQLAKTLSSHPQDIPAQVRKTLTQHLTGVTLLQLSDLLGWDVICEIETRPVAEIADIVRRLIQNNEPFRATELLGKWHSTLPDAAKTPSVIFDLFDPLCSAIPHGTCTADTAQHFRQILTIAPRHQGARNRMRDLRHELRQQMQAGVAMKDSATLDQLARVNALLPTPVKDLDLHRARLRFDIGDFDGARDAGLLAVTSFRDLPSLWMLMLRCAVKLNDVRDMQYCAQRVIVLCEGRHERFVAEARGYVTEQAGAA